MAGSNTERPVLMLVTDQRRTGDALLGIIDASVDAGVDIVQIREKDLPYTELRMLAQEIVSVVDGRARVTVNSDVDLAVELGIDLHLPEVAAPLTDEQTKELGPNQIVGRSIHSSNVVAEDRIDYLVFGHVFATTSKRDLRPRGLNSLTRVVECVQKPVWAIGGITVENAASVVERGAHGIAVIGAILGASDPREATQALRSEIDRAARLLTANTRMSE